jgi:hypothetical protein
MASGRTLSQMPVSSSCQMMLCSIRPLRIPARTIGCSARPRDMPRMASICAGVRTVSLSWSRQCLSHSLQTVALAFHFWSPIFSGLDDEVAVELGLAQQEVVRGPAEDEGLLGLRRLAIRVEVAVLEVVRRAGLRRSCAGPTN